MYFQEQEVKNLLLLMMERYPGGEIIFDGASKLGIKIGNKRTKKDGKNEMRWYYYLKKPDKQIHQWSPKLKVIDYFSYWAHTPRNSQWSKTSQKLMKISDFLKLGLIARVKFLK